jgi:hypothetical protein
LIEAIVTWPDADVIASPMDRPPAGVVVLYATPVALLNGSESLLRIESVWVIWVLPATCENR